MTKVRPINEYDVLKAFAILLVVIGHITILFTPEAYPKDDVKMAHLITFGIYLFHMPLFMCISGAVYQLNKYKPKYQQFIPFVINKIKRLIIPYFFVGLLGLLPVLVYLNPELSWTDPKTFAKILLAEDCRHLWYLLALFWIFIFQFIADRFNTNLYLLFVFSSVLTLFMSWLFPNFHFMCLEMALRKWPCFILGMIMVRTTNLLPIKRSILISIAGGGISSCIILLSSNYYIDMVFSLIMPYFICVFLILSARRLTLSDKWQSVVREVAGYSFGIYLFHVMIIYLLRHWLSPFIGIWILMTVMFIISMTSSIGIAYILRKIKLSFIIGE